MSDMDQLLETFEHLPINEKWRLVNQMLRSLEKEQAAPTEQSDWHQFLRETYGAFRDTPIQRWEQGEYEQREPLE